MVTRRKRKPSAVSTQQSALVNCSKCSPSRNDAERKDLRFARAAFQSPRTAGFSATFPMTVEWVCGLDTGRVLTAECCLLSADCYLRRALGRNARIRGRRRSCTRDKIHQGKSQLLPSVKT